MALTDELLRQVRDHTFGTAVLCRRHAFVEWRNLSNAHFASLLTFHHTDRKGTQDSNRAGSLSGRSRTGRRRAQDARKSASVRIWPRTRRRFRHATRGPARSSGRDNFGAYRCTAARRPPRRSAAASRPRPGGLKSPDTGATVRTSAARSSARAPAPVAGPVRPDRLPRQTLPD